MSIYLNNAATTWPKPKEVAEAMASFLSRGGANLARGTSSERDMDTLNVVLDCRMRLASLLGGYEGGDPRYVTFCANVTEALNVVLWGFVKPGMRVLTSSMEHNAVMRPLRALEAEGVKLVLIPSHPDGLLDLDALKDALSKGNCDLMVLSHASNVCGTVQPLEEAAELCRGAGVPLVLDTAQTAGVLPLDASALGLAALCFTGHKGLMGPQGIGGILWRPDFAARVAPFVMGGDGELLPPGDPARGAARPLRVRHAEPAGHRGAQRRADVAGGHGARGGRRQGAGAGGVLPGEAEGRGRRPPQREAGHESASARVLDQPEGHRQRGAGGRTLPLGRGQARFRDAARAALRPFGPPLPGDVP